ncbi:MAG: dTDP-4-dehydrorhamnose reductase [Chitinispirillales bacterium]|jgi:dTDP-4-dehydrorhamnose reductase|nr:dTDP-4-dehydrorhamnose reductase [Chitinispirillales bacterium]
MIWIVGANGMLGRETTQILAENGLKFYETDVEVDITDIGRVKEFIFNKTFSHIINCAAYTAVDAAEDDFEKAMAINRYGVANLAFAAAALDACLIHISTDYVFDGVLDAPLTEESVVNPIGIYGKTKLLGEYAIELSALKKYFIIRTAWLYGKHGKNFVNTMLNLMNVKESVGVVADQWGSPTWARDLAKFITFVIKEGDDDYGTYHYSGDGKTNWYEFAVKIYEYGRKNGLIANECKINALTAEQYPAKAKRPKYSYLSKEKVKKTFEINIPEWEDALEKYLDECRLLSSLENNF